MNLDACHLLSNAVKIRRKTSVAARLAAVLLGAAAFSGQAQALSLNEAVSVTLESNPQIGQAVQNREAIEFELRQARGLFLPSVDLETSVGVRGLDNPSRRISRIEDDELYPSDVGISITQKLFDGGARRAELERQAARVDSASFRVLERSETLALQVVREYLEYLLQTQIVEESKQNEGFHRRITGEIDSLISAGALTDADKQQARERLLASQIRTKEALEELEAAKIRFFTVVGKPLTNPSRPASVARAIPANLDTAIGIARSNNPRIRIADSDIDVAEALVRDARSRYMPEVFAEGRARVGNDIDGSAGRTSDLQARVVAKWNLYRGGIDTANEQEQIRRVSEQRLALHQSHREVEEAVRISWDRRIRQTDLARSLREQAATNGQLVRSYREQLAIGQRSLLDVLSAQNTNYNISILARTADFAALFAEYRILASTGTLLKTLGMAAPKQADAYARTEFNVPATPSTDTHARQPSNQVNSLPLDLLAPIRK
jgi:adhesin transport system outer membrane protein